MRNELINWKHYTTICPAAPTEYLATEALKVREELAGRSKDIIETNVRLCREFCDRHSNVFTWRPPQAGSVAFIEINLERLGVSSATDYCHFLAKEHGVILLPGACLGFDDKFVRVGLGRVGFKSALEAYERTFVNATA